MGFYQKYSKKWGKQNLTALFLFLSICTVCYTATVVNADDGEYRSSRDPCSKIQHEIQKAIIHHKWGLDNLKFQQRLKRHPKYIVTIQQIRSLHEPIVDLRCGIQGLAQKKLEFHFHETRFTADSVRLFDIHSIFPIHTGAMSVKLKLDPLIVTMDKLREDYPSINEVYFSPSSSSSGSGSDFAKEHREDSDSVLDLEKEIESVFINRIQPDIQKQLSQVISSALKKYFLQNNVKF